MATSEAIAIIIYAVNAHRSKNNHCMSVLWAMTQKAASKFNARKNSSNPW